MEYRFTPKGNAKVLTLAQVCQMLRLSILNDVILYHFVYVIQGIQLLCLRHICTLGESCIRH